MPQNKEYIEREAVQKIIDYIRDKYCTYYNRSCKITQFWWDTIRYFEKRIRALPADVAEVRYGQVIVHEGCEDEYYEYCSECETMDIHSGDNFCPNCGCKLVGVKHSKTKE